MRIITPVLLSAMSIKWNNSSEPVQYIYFLAHFDKYQETMSLLLHVEMWTAAIEIYKHGRVSGLKKKPAECLLFAKKLSSEHNGFFLKHLPSLSRELWVLRATELVFP